VIRICERYFDNIPELKGDNTRKPFIEYNPKTKISKRTTLQAHCGIGRTAYALYDPRRLPFVLLTNILGGPGMNSRLNLGIREKYGFVYSIDASYSSFTD